MNIRPPITKLSLSEMAQSIYQAMQAQYYDTQANLYRENAPSKADDRAYAFLWPYSSVISALNVLARLPKVGVTYHTDLVRALDGLAVYWDGIGTRAGSPPGYEAYPTHLGGDTKFYDDNAWLGLEFAAAYQTLQMTAYLDRARTLFDFAVSGWTNIWEGGTGGIFWREDDFETKNTCSNGPVAVLAVKLYSITGDTSYLDWASRLLAWLTPLRAPYGVYWDALRHDGSIDERTYTYNTGTPLHTNALLYTITGEPQYLLEARSLAQGSLAHFTKAHSGLAQGLFPATPWFNAVLLRGYLALYEVDPAHDPQYIDALRDNLLYAWDHARDAQGLLDADWSGATSLAHKPLLDQGGSIEILALLALHDGS